MKNIKFENLIFVIGVAVLLTIGALRIFDFILNNSVTIDERTHIGAGMQWLKDGKFTYEPKHPPLARVFSAIGPYLAGVNRFKSTGVFEDGHYIVFNQDNPLKYLTLSRLGILPFFILASMIIALFGRQMAGVAGGLLALFFFTFTPSVLAHAGLSTTDMALTGTLITTVYILQKWLFSPKLHLVILLGVFTALTVLSKLTSLLLLPVCFLSVYLCYFYDKKREGITNTKNPMNLSNSAVLCIAVFFTLWAGYRFSYQTANSVAPYFTDKLLGIFESNKGLRDFFYFISCKLPIPMPELLLGVKESIRHGLAGHEAYLLGQTSSKGWWYFFIIAFGVKTPLAFVIFTLAGIVLHVRDVIQRSKVVVWPLLVPVSCFLAIMVIMLKSSINIGIRHILPIYGFAALISAYGIIRIFNSNTRLKPFYISLVAVLISWNSFSSLCAHPNYIPYFNETSLLTKDPILIDSDRDWGQTIYRVRDYIKKNHIQDIKVALLGFWECDVDAYHLHEASFLEPDKEIKGWIAISAFCYFFAYRNRVLWLHRYKPEEIIGKSVYIYHIR